MILMQGERQPVESAESGTITEERMAPASVMKKAYYLPRAKYFKMPEDRILSSSPFAILRADHGHGEIFSSILPNAQANSKEDILAAGAGLFHATSRVVLPNILREGIKPMGRAASMYSMFHHMDTNRARGLQRCGSNECNIIISIRTDVIIQHVALSDMFVAGGNVSIQVPVPRAAFDRVVQPTNKEDSTEGGIVLFDASWAK